MAFLTVSGDPLLTRAQSLAFGYNAQGRTEVGELATALLTRYPAAFSAYSKLCKRGRITAGISWIWPETQPRLIFLAVRDSPVGATRLRYVQSVALALARDYALQGITSLAIAPLGRASEWPEIQSILETWFKPVSFPVICYTTFQPGVQADEGLG